MKEATEKALKATVEKANNSPALDAMQLTQAALHCLALTKEGHPGHPLYLRKTLTPVPMGSNTQVQQ